jgi:tetratricopeptide (TPR) repeat protein
VSAHAVDLLLAAGEAALARAALPSADSLFGQALDLAATPDGRSRVLLGLARSATGAARFDEALATLGEARQLAREAASSALEADVVSWLTRVSWLAGRWDDAVAGAAEAVGILDGLPESPELARALARRSQIGMLRGLPEAEEHAAEAIEVARRVGDRFAEANARINLVTTRAMRGDVPDEAEMLDIVDSAVAAGAYDEAFRAIVNYLWSAQPHVSVDHLEQSIDGALARLGNVGQIEAYDEYLLLSRAKFLWIPSGRWAEIDPIVAGPENRSGGGNRIVWLEIVAGTLLRRGDLERADALLPELRRMAVESGEPQRILPMAGIVLPRAALAGDRTTLRDITSIMLGLPGRAYWTLITAPAIPRALAHAGEEDALQRFADALEDGQAVGSLRISKCASRGFLALVHGHLDDAVVLFREAVVLERARDAHYAAACAELDLALALEATGNGRGADEARTRAAAVLGPLGCVNPF